MTKTLVEEYVADPINMRLFQQERAIFEVTARLEEAMEEEGVSRSELAKRLGKSRGWVTQLLDGEANKTIRTVADAFAVLGRAYRSFDEPVQISNASIKARPAIRTKGIDTISNEIGSVTVRREEAMSDRPASNGQPVPRKPRKRNHRKRAT